MDRNQTRRLRIDEKGQSLFIFPRKPSIPSLPVQNFCIVALIRRHRRPQP